MSDSHEKWSSLHPDDEASEMKRELWRHLRAGLLPGRLDERLLLALWRSLYSSLRSDEDPKYPADIALVGTWYGMLLSSVDKSRKELSDEDWSNLEKAAYRAVTMEIQGRAAGRRGVAAADEWVLVQTLEKVGASPPAQPEQ